MPNSSNDWNRNRRGSSENWDDDYDRSDYNRNRNYRNEYNDTSYGNSGSTGNYGYSQSPGNYGSRYGEEYNDRNSGGDDYRRNRDMYGNSMDMNRGSGSYSNTGYGDWNRRGRGYSDSDYGRNRSNDRDWWNKTKDEVSSWFGDDDAQRRRRMDEMNERNHRGKGPKGYTRSDERITEDVNDRLSDDPQVDASEIEVTVNNCEVTLTGTVSSRWEKRHAEDVVERVSGVKNVENRLKVNSSYSSGSSNDITSTSYRSGEANR